MKKKIVREGDDGYVLEEDENGERTVSYDSTKDKTSMDYVEQSKNIVIESSCGTENDKSGAFERAATKKVLEPVSKKQEDSAASSLNASRITNGTLDAYDAIGKALSGDQAPLSPVNMLRKSGKENKNPQPDVIVNLAAGDDDAVVNLAALAPAPADAPAPKRLSTKSEDAKRQFEIFNQMRKVEQDGEQAVEQEAQADQSLVVVDERESDNEGEDHSIERSSTPVMDAVLAGNKGAATVTAAEDGIVIQRGVDGQSYAVAACTACTASSPSSMHVITDYSSTVENAKRLIS